jgi:hypothetical protein
MSMNATTGRSRQTARRLRAIRDRLAVWRRQARRGATLALVTAGMSLGTEPVGAQMGQTAMAPAGGVVNRAVNGLRSLNQNGPGVLYYGVNAADRGLGYLGSYMTLGGFVPGFEDDLGGFWAADLRGHLSEYGGFFSNVGAVRKQFIGGTLLGVGVYWDYDGDLNQYADTVIPSVGQDVVFPGGQVYNQVGISGEWLTDYGNLRSNGYIPVGSTGQLAGPFVGNSILCVNGVNAGLGGADLEVGAYVPALADWAGMINVGGYAYGNTRYEFADGQAAVPWFGGVYTRLDLTFVQNWDFSLQYNNDSYFDSTGFARLTYRMGGSRRRNVPDQVEQPMMRNEHIVRAHQAPEVAYNPNNVDAAGNPLPWQMFHVDSSATAPGDGTFEAPFQTLAQAQAAALAAYDIVYVNVGNSLTNPYLTAPDGYSFQAANQYLIGQGSTFSLPTVACGDFSLASLGDPNVYPQVSNPLGPAINLSQPGVTVSHLRIFNSAVGISDSLGIAAPGSATVQDVIIEGGGGPFQRGVQIANSTGRISFAGVRLSNLSNDGFVVSAADGDVVIADSSLTDVAGTAVLVSGNGADVAVTRTSFIRTDGTVAQVSGDNAVLDIVDSTVSQTLNALGSVGRVSGQDSLLRVTNSQISDSEGFGFVASGTDSRVDLTDTNVETTGESALVASGLRSRINATSTAIAGTGNPGVTISGDSSQVMLDDSSVANTGGTGVSITGPDAIFEMTNGSLLTDTAGNGIELLESTAIAYVLDNSTISNTGNDGIVSTGASLLLQGSAILNAGGAGIRANNVTGPNVVAVQGGAIQGAVDGGILVENSDLRVEQLDPLDPTSRQTVIQNTGDFGIRAVANTSGPPTNLFRIDVDEASISGADVGIAITAGADGANPPPAPVPTIAFLATNNNISATGGAAIDISAIFQGDPPTPFPGQPLSRVNALIVDNAVDGGGDSDILLSTGGDEMTWQIGGFDVPTPAPERPITIAAGGVIALQGLNNGADIDIQPDTSQINFAPGAVIPEPPPAPIPPP